MSQAFLSRALGISKHTQRLLALAAAAVVPQLLAPATHGGTINILGASINSNGSSFDFSCNWDTISGSHDMYFYVCENSTTGPWTFFASTGGGSINGAPLPWADRDVTYEFYLDDGGNTSNVFGIYVGP